MSNHETERESGSRSIEEARFLAGVFREPARLRARLILALALSPPKARLPGRKRPGPRRGP